MPAAIRLLGGLVLLVGVLWCSLVLAIYLFGKRDEARPADAIIVLGAAQYDGRPSPVLRARLDHALELYRDGVAPVIVFTGGVGVGDTVSEAEVGRRYAIREGVPEGAIRVEREGLSTNESMLAAAALLADEGLGSAVLVSDPFHMLRLRLLASRLGLRAYSSPTRTSPIGGSQEREWRHILRESFILPLAFLSHG
jgi:uncharacterized SAM-binding protein YcdF (DUF218 family)